MAVQGQFTGGGDVEFTLRIDTSQTKKDMAEVIATVEVVERMLSETLSLIRRISGNDDLNTFISLVQRALALANQLYIISNLLSAGTPAGLILALIGTAGIVLTISDTVGSYA